MTYYPSNKHDSDVVLMANALRAASDEDTMAALNVQSSKKEEDLQKLAYYVVPMEWMRRAWPILTLKQTPANNHDWRQDIGHFRIRPLLQLVSQPSSDTAEEKVDAATAKIAVDQYGHPVLRSDVKHAVDYALLGSQAWLLLQSKFGFDEMLCCPTVFYTSVDSVIAVQVPIGNDHVVTTIPLPSTGRFPYEKYIETPEQLTMDGLHKVDEDASQSARSFPGNVSDEDTAAEEAVDGDDLFPGLVEDERMSLDQQNDDEHKILSLPLSTTYYDNQSNPQSDDYWNMSPKATNDKKVISERFKHGSGLGNLGNTCFMNSTLQCLAHTPPLQKYFLSREYERDLNRDNLLGTGGELATKFAQLLAEMWGTNSRDVMGSSAYVSTNVVYPREFKYTLGKHAEQFVGYDQHDSQELATYLLDALHEDTNRVTKKPFVEKPEQGEDETDEEAAEKAWQLHLKREDSRIVENFVGQVKSRVQCCEEGCGRVSTTFDPFMYLSVPLPGSTEKTLRITFVPLDPSLKPMNLTVTLAKTASFAELLQKVKDTVAGHAGYMEIGSAKLADLIATDVWQDDIVTYYDTDIDVDRVNEKDTTFVYQLRPLSEVQQIIQKAVDDSENEGDLIGLSSTPRRKRYKLDIATLTAINSKGWQSKYSTYLKEPLVAVNAFNKKKGTTEARVQLYQKTIRFIDSCVDTLEGKIASPSDSDSEEQLTEPSDVAVQELIDRCDTSRTFERVENLRDLAILEFLVAKMRNEILELEKEKKKQYPDGVLIQIRIRKMLSFSSRETVHVLPFLIRIPSNMTVYDLRAELAQRLNKCLKSYDRSSPGQATSESNPTESNAESTEIQTPTSSSIDVSSMMIIRQIPLTFDRKQISYRSAGQKLGSLDREVDLNSDSKKSSLASRNDEDESDNVAEFVGDRGTVYMNWPSELYDMSFDQEMYESVVWAGGSDSDDGLNGNGSKVVTVEKCIEKFCQMEQLDESEMWYCNRCKKHVRAWKQFHIYRSPPILIIHLKRFMFSAISHRRDKINVFVDFPLTNLDLTDQVMHYSDDEKPIYDCYAVSNHYGGLGGGHYTAHALNDDGVWCYYDDGRINPDCEPQDIVTKAAYVLYYRRRDVKPGIEILEQTPTPAIATLPNIVRDGSDPVQDGSDVSSSNAAIVGNDDQMEIEDDDFESCSTSVANFSNVEQEDDDLNQQSSSNNLSQDKMHLQ